MSRGAIAVLSTENLLHNLGIVTACAKNSKILAMIKANAYGHGLRSVARRLENRVANLGVASIDEALAIRKAGIKSPITLMEGVFESDEFTVASAEGFHIVIHDSIQLEWLAENTLIQPIHVWLKVDTGMGRLGFLPEDAFPIYESLISNPKVVQPVGIMSHLACADDFTHPMNGKQIEVFNKFLQCLPIDTPKSLSNSAAIFNFSIAHHEVVRPGLALYGISPCRNKTSDDLNLKPVMTLQSRLIAVKRIRKGSSIGYESKFVCSEDMLIGIVAMGYGDGYPRTARNGTPVMVNKILCSLVGRISMDMMTIDLKNCPSAAVGDPVILWGDSLPIESIASHTSNIPYDLITGVQQRVRFIWTPDLDEPHSATTIQNIRELTCP